jgi:hypothetical protein
MTVQAIIDRLYRTYLEPPTYQPARCWLQNTVSSTTQDTFQLGAFSVPEDKELLRNGILIEAGQELLTVRGVDDPSLPTPTVTVERGSYGTEPATYDPDTEIRLSPMFSKASAFEAVRDNIITLHPKLFTIDIEHVSPVGPAVYPCHDGLAISVESAWPFEGMTNIDVTVKIVEHHPIVGGRAYIASGWAGDLWIRYRRRMGVATDVTDTLESIGMDAVWSNIVTAGAAADMMAGRDIPASHTDYVSKIIEPEMVPVGTKQSLAVGLRRYRDYLIEGFASEMKAEYKPVVRRRSPFKAGRV